jgi:hypothetical protein
VQRLTWNVLDIKSVLNRKKEAIGKYFVETVPGCGVPYCGRYPKGFVGNFTVPYEIYWER